MSAIALPVFDCRCCGRRHLSLWWLPEGPGVWGTACPETGATLRVYAETARVGEPGEIVEARLQRVAEEYAL